ncbi:beta-lactamase-like protein [Mycolicibacterium tokaiense]|uniref:Beta-lactamase-like protein n=2 Tax=Mycolicibacterium tokaiense TaxID=39695 RepID=A0A378TMI6_9MYCO|nr:beta-lactamase-like protein [Mycolicibacterium tokaiense]
MDDVTFTYVVDGAMWLAADGFLPAIPQSYWDDHPDEVGPDGLVAMSTGGLLVQSPLATVLIDAGMGQSVGESALGRTDCGEFLNTLARLGVDRDAIEVCALTHLHVDHAGWIFVQDGPGPRQPTFPRAQYVVAEAEWAPLQRGERPMGASDRESVLEPLGRHHNVVFIADGDEVAPGVRALVTPGHSAGHTSYVITSSAGNRLVAFGDAFHVPAQLANPEWGSAPDTMPATVPTARAQLLDELCRPGTFGFAIHFGDQPFGQVMREPGAARWQPLATDVLFGPPR